MALSFAEGFRSPAPRRHIQHIADGKRRVGKRQPALTGLVFVRGKALAVDNNGKFFFKNFFQCQRSVDKRSDNARLLADADMDFYGNDVIIFYACYPLLTLC